MSRQLVQEIKLVIVLMIEFVSKLDTKAVQMTRTLSRGLAPVVERLELERPQLVTLRDIEAICRDENLGTEPRVVASRLKKAGWLLPTGRRGSWEFAPAELAGPYSSCDPLLPVKALSAASSNSSPLLRGQTAAWALGLADRVPSTVEVVLPEKACGAIPAGVSACVYQTNLGPVRAKGALSLAPEAIIVQMAERPSSVRSWEGAAEWLPDVMSEAVAEAILEELKGKSVATGQRVGYLMQGARADIADELLKVVRPKSVAWFGRGKAKRTSGKWKVADAKLPWDPEKMGVMV